MSDFLPEFTASAVFTDDGSGPLTFIALPSVGIAAEIFPFFKGDTGPPGPPGPTTGDLTYTHPQGTASAIWTITHNLGKKPSVVVQDSAYDTVDGDVYYIDLYSLTITFSAAFSGFAYLN